MDYAKIDSYFYMLIIQYMKNEQGASTNTNPNQIDKVEIERELNSLNQSIDTLHKSLDGVESGKKLSTEDLIRLASNGDENEYGENHKNLAERIDQSKGFFKFWTVKVPARNLSIASLTQNQQSINDSIRALSSPICPICANGILMFNKKAIPNELGNVRWFCSNGKECSYSIFAEPSLLKISSVLNNSKIQEVGRLRWEALSEEDKAELIDRHFFRANLFRSFAACLVAFILIMAYMHYIWGTVISLLCLIYIVLGSLRWCYRAWQIKTGSVYLESSAFIHWIKNAEEYYSLDWLDEPETTETSETEDKE